MYQDRRAAVFVRPGRSSSRLVVLSLVDIFFPTVVSADTRCEPVPSSPSPIPIQAPLGRGGAS